MPGLPTLSQAKLMAQKSPTGENMWAAVCPGVICVTPMPCHAAALLSHPWAFTAAEEQKMLSVVLGFHQAVSTHILSCAFTLEQLL